MGNFTEQNWGISVTALTARGRANPASSASNALTRPTIRAVSVSSSVPALDTDPAADELYLTLGYEPVVFLLEVASSLSS